GLFSTSTGLFYGGGWSQLGIQALGVLAVAAWTMGVMAVFLYLVTRFSPIRVSEEEELSGLDFTEHGSNAYELNETLLDKGALGASSQTAHPAYDYPRGLAERLNRMTS